MKDNEKAFCSFYGIKEKDFKKNKSKYMKLINNAVSDVLGYKGQFEFETLKESLLRQDSSQTGQSVYGLVAHYKTCAGYDGSEVDSYELLYRLQKVVLDGLASNSVHADEISIEENFSEPTSVDEGEAEIISSEEPESRMSEVLEETSSENKSNLIFKEDAKMADDKMKEMEQKGSTALNNLNGGSMPTGASEEEQNIVRQELIDSFKEELFAFPDFTLSYKECYSIVVLDMNIRLAIPIQ